MRASNEQIANILLSVLFSVTESEQIFSVVAAGVYILCSCSQLLQLNKIYNEPFDMKPRALN